MKFVLCLLLLSSTLNASSHNPEEYLKEIAGKKNEGSLIVKLYCNNCHAEKPLIPLGAPRAKNLLDWQQRVANFSDLLIHTQEGINAMPARGGCFECSDHQLLLAIYELLPEKLAKKLPMK